MKVYTTETQQNFKPVTLHIQIESQEELKILSKLFKYDVSVPEEVFKDDKPKQTRLSELMGSIHDKLVTIV